MSEELTPESITAKLKEKGVLEDVKEEKQDAVQEEKAEKSVSEEEEVLADDSKEEAPVAEESENELDEVEQEAMKKGWNPEGEKSADEFLRAEPLYKEIKKRGKQIESLRSQMDELMKHVSGMKKAGYQDRLDAIRAERDEAVIRSDVESVNYYDDELSNLQEEMKAELKDDSMHPAAQNFVESHKDLFSDYSLEAMEIKKFLNERDVELSGFNLDPEVHIQTLEKDLAAKYPQKFGKKEAAPKEPKVQAVESDTRPVTSKKKAKFTYKDLTHDQKQIYKHMEKRNVMSGEEYIKQLVDIGELK